MSHLLAPHPPQPHPIKSCVLAATHLTNILMSFSGTRPAAAFDSGVPANATVGFDRAKAGGSMLTDGCLAAGIEE